MRVLRKNKTEAVLDRLAAAADVYVPMLRGPGSGFFSWKTYDEDYDDLVLDRLNVYMPPKQIIISPAERSKSVLDDVSAAQDKIIFGLRGCDLWGLTIQDEWFMAEDVTGKSAAEAYKARRERIAIIANACYHPAPTCFCTDLGVDPLAPAGADIVIRDAGKSGYVWESCTPKGQQLTEVITDLLEEQDSIDLPTLLPFQLWVEFGGVTEKLSGMLDHPLWEKHSEACQSCALCTYTCPTCYCPELQVKPWREAGYAFGCYDSCAYQNEALRNGTASPREAATARFKNRFLHKLLFYPQRYGRPLCTGCGRCLAVCPAAADMAKIVQAIREVQ